MKRFLLALGFVLIFVTSSFAASNITFVWDASTSTDVAGYKLYQSTISGSYDSSKVVADISAPNTTARIENIQDGTYFWVVTAYDGNGNESGYSNEVTRDLDTTAPNAPGNLTVEIIVKVIVTNN